MSDGLPSAPPLTPSPSAEIPNSFPSESSASPSESGGQKSFAARLTQGFFENLGKATGIEEMFESNEEGEKDEEKKERVIVKRVIEEEKFPLDDPDKFIEDTVEVGVATAFNIVFRLFGLPI